MDFSAIVQSLVGHFSWPLFIAVVLFLVSEYLGANPSTPAGSIFQVVKAAAKAFIEQITKPKQAEPVQVVADKVEPTATPQA